MRHSLRSLGVGMSLVICSVGSLAAQAPRHRSGPTTAEAQRFMDSVETHLAELARKAQQAEWVNQTYITYDTERIATDARRELGVAVQRFAVAARRYERVKLDPELARKFNLLRLSLAAPPPADAKEAAEMTALQTGMQGDYGRGTYCKRSDKRDGAKPVADSAASCLQINELSRILAESRNPAELLDAWQGWHRVGAPMRDRYARFVELANKGARGIGFADAGAMWRSGYDMPPEAFAAETERLWQQVKPLYLALHAYVRSRLAERYGPQVVPADGLIPAHLLGNMWAQEWGNIYPLVAPAGGAPTYDVTQLLKQKQVDQFQMVRYGERFFTSLGFDSLPGTFWQRSMIVKPRDRNVVCHASAWDVDDENDLRIKMCTEVTGEDFVTVHHELGHNFYQRAYNKQPPLFRDGANDGFHEAIGDAIALAITPAYLRQVGLLQSEPSAAADTALLLQQALDKVAFLPFGLLIDQWRWKVFSGEITPANYNKAWWELRAKYQGVAPPLPRSEADFDPGAKYHVAANVPYTRYFLARILQFQFYRALCREAGYTGPLHRCSFYGSKAAGARLAKMLEAGRSRPWPETLYAMTGERQMDAGAMLEYFAPLKAWLDRQNAGKAVGWQETAAR